MRISTGLPAIPDTCAEVLPPRAVADLYAWLSEAYRQIEVAVNGGLETDENVGVTFAGTFAVAVDTVQVFTHGLGRKPSFFSYLWNDSDLAAHAGAPIIYTTPVAKALWDTDVVRLFCTENTDGSGGAPNLTFVGWVL